MTDKELRRLKKSELLELMLYLRQELDKVRLENEELRSRLEMQVAEKTAAEKKLLETVFRMEKQISALCTAQDIEIHFEENEEAPDVGKSAQTETEDSDSSVEMNDEKELS